MRLLISSCTLLLFLLFLISTVLACDNHHQDYDDDDDNDDNRQDIVSSPSDPLKYLPAFNIVDHSKYLKWQKYIDLIRDASEKYWKHQQQEQQQQKQNATSCQIFLPLIDSDLDYFVRKFGANFITKDFVDRIKASKRGIHYRIVSHRLYREQSCLFPSRCDGVEHFLRPLVSTLPNMDIFINVRDYPQVGKYFAHEQTFPIFSFSKDVTNYADIIYPAWTYWSGGPALDIYPRGIGRWDLMRDKLLQAQQRWSPWSNRSDVAFFRGSRTSAKRDPIVLLSRAKPNLIDAKYTKNQAWKSKADTLGEPPASTVSFEDHCRYKYLFNAQGVAASFRLKHLFLCQSVVLNVNSDWIEFFYPPLQPWIHYVPVDGEFRDAEEILQFLRDNTDIGEYIARAGFEFIRDHLTMDTIGCYWHHLLHSYSRRLLSDTYRPEVVDEDMFEIL